MTFLFDRMKVLLEALANAAIVIAVAIALGVWARQRHSPTPAAGTELRASENTAVGSRVQLPGVDWSKHPETLVLAISTACHFCIESTPFYRDLTRSPHLASIVVAMPQKQPVAEEFLRQHTIVPSTTVSIPLTEIDVEGTPTLLMVSSNGTITKSWVGELSRTQQQQVLASVDARS